MIIDDVITAGTAIREVMAIIEQAGATPAATVIAVNRMERGQGELSAIQEVERDYGMQVISIVSLDNIIEYLEETKRYPEALGPISEYRSRYGV